MKLLKQGMKVHMFHHGIFISPWFHIYLLQKLNNSFYPLLSTFYILHHFQNKLIFTSIKIEIERWNIHNSSRNNKKNSDVIFHSFIHEINFNTHMLPIYTKILRE